MPTPTVITEKVRTSIDLGESHFREFKSAEEGPPEGKSPRTKKSIASDICTTLVGFANADGGTLLVGVEDDGTVTGIPEGFDFDYLENCWKDGVHKRTPLSQVQSYLLEIDEKKVLYFSVLKSSKFVHQTADGKCLQRRDLETVPISVEELTYTRQEQLSQEYDRQFVDGAEVSDLDPKILEILVDQVSKGMSFDRCLQHLGLADFNEGGIRLRRAAVLLFAKDINKFHPRVQLRIMRVSGTELLTGNDYNVTTDEYVEGNIVQLIENSWDKLRPHLVQTKLSGTAKFESKVMYPELACREALINGIAHRDYSQEGRGIEIYIFDDRLEVKSPGGLLSTLSIAALKELSGAHQSRNTFIARVLRELGYMREVGEGMRRIFDLMRSNELAEPEIASDQESFSVQLRNKALYSQEHLLWLDNFAKFDLSREENAIIVLGYDGKSLSTNDIFDNLGIVDTEHYRKLIAALQEKGILTSAITKKRAVKVARLSKSNVRDVPRFAIGIPDETPQTVRENETSKKRKSRGRIPKSDGNELEARLFITNLPEGLGEKELLNAFRDQGYTVDITWPKSRSGGRRRSYAFLQFDSSKEAGTALEALDGLKLGDRTLVVRKAEPRRASS